MKQELINYFCQNDILIHQQAYIQYKMKIPPNKSIWEFLCTATTLNNTMIQLLLLYNASQKLQAGEFLYTVHSNPSNSYQKIIKYHGLHSGDENVSIYFDMWKRATIKDSDTSHRYLYQIWERRQKAKGKERPILDRKESKETNHKKKNGDKDEHYCSHHR